MVTVTGLFILMFISAAYTQNQEKDQYQDLMQEVFNDQTQELAQGTSPEYETGEDESTQGSSQKTSPCVFTT